MKKRSGIPRRALVAAAPAAAAAPLLVPASVFGSDARSAPSRRIGVGVIGAGRQGLALISRLAREPDVELVAVCEVDRTRRDNARRALGTRGAAFNDHRELLARKDVDAVVIATPDHWHAIQAIDACQARKDVYCETPLTTTIHEARAVVEAARKHGRVFQTGSQQRAEYEGRFRIACEYVRSGRIGKLLAIYAGIGGGVSRWCDLPEEPMEPGLDWDRWLGPAPLRPYHSALSPRGVHDAPPAWRQFREYAGGPLAEQGAHHFDVVQWALDADRSGPAEIIPPGDPRAERGLRYVYARGVELIHGGPAGITFVGVSGSIFVDRNRLASNPDKILLEPLGDRDVRLPHAPGLLRDWLDCIKTRRRPLCDVEIGARSATVAHLGALAYWHHRPLRWDPQTWKMAGEDHLSLDRDRRDPYKLPKA
jgi:predicted dehydrogenase